MVAHQVDAAVLLGDATGPDVGREVLDGFGLSDAVRGVAHYMRLWQARTSSARVCNGPRGYRVSRLLVITAISTSMSAELIMPATATGGL
jgi:hypothetical protein